MRMLHALSLAYIGAPVVIFLAGYVRPLFALPAIAVLAFSLHRQSKVAEPAEQTLSPARLFAIVALASALAVALGFGGFAAQDGDYAKHNALFKDLMELEWPLAYADAGPDLRPRVLNTYLGYYLPAALFGKVFGVAAGFVFSFAWAAFGLVLAILWFLRLVGAPRFAYALLFLFFGGIDLLGHVAIAGKWPGPEPLADLASWMMKGDLAAMNGVFWIFPSHPGTLANAPHHVLPSWIAFLMMLDDAIRRRSAKRALFLWATTFYASTFFALGMAPFVACALLQSPRVRDAITFENTLAFLATAGIALLYTASNEAAFTHGFLWEYVHPLRALSYLLLFYAVGIGLYLLFWPGPADQAAAQFRPWLAIAVACVLAFPLYRIGPAMEFPVKALLPAVLVFVAAFTAALESACRHGGWRASKVPISLAAVGALSGVLIVAWAGVRGLSLDFYDRGVQAIQRFDVLTRSDLGLQLFSSGTSFFWRHVAPEPRYHREARAAAAAESTRFLPDDAAALLHERFAGGRIAPSGHDTLKVIAPTPEALAVEVVIAPGPRQDAEWAVLLTNEAQKTGFAVQQFGAQNNRYYLGIAGTPRPFVSTPVAAGAEPLDYLVFSFAEGSIATFVNGARRSSDAAPAGFRMAASTTPVMIGNGRALQRAFNGRVYEVRVTAAPATEAEVAARWARIAALAKGLPR